MFGTKLQRSNKLWVFSKLDHYLKVKSLTPVEHFQQESELWRRKMAPLIVAAF